MKKISIPEEIADDIEWIRKHKEFKEDAQVVIFLVKFYYHKIGRIRIKDPTIAQMMENIRRGLG